MRTKLYCLLTGFFAAAATVSVQAHHAFSAEFDNDKPIRLEGTVTKWEWINPHAWINLDVVNEAGEVEHWRVEGGAPNALIRRGWTKDSLPPGTEIIIEGFLARDGSMRASGQDITFTDGSKLFVGSGGIGAAPGREEE